MHEFRSDDAGYLSWLATHPAGYVINTERNYDPADARMHRADCSTLCNQTGAQTDYVKVCANHIADLDAWDAQPRRRGDPAKRPLQTQPPPRKSYAGDGDAPAASVPPVADRFTLPPPAPGNSVVEAWADDYIHYQPRPEWAIVAVPRDHFLV